MLKVETNTMVVPTGTTETVTTTTTETPSGTTVKKVITTYTPGKGNPLVLMFCVIYS